MEFADIAAAAKSQGMMMVNSDETDALINECEEKIQEADELCDIVDPENKPFESKYKARDLLDKLLQRLEAARTVARLEAKRTTSEKLSQKIASIQVKVGSISWDCEEPHSAQKDLELACEFYYPQLLDTIQQQVGDRDELLSGDESVAPKTDDLKPPPLSPHPLSLLVDALKCLNTLGILWAGRGQPHKALLFLQSAENVYLQYSSATNNLTHTVTHTFAAPNPLEKDLHNTYTHTLFYLAQAYGHLKEPEKSSDYCFQTLQRQLATGLKDTRAALDWVKNCAGIADFFKAMDDSRKCALALASAEKVLKEVVIKTLYAQFDSIEGSTTASAAATTTEDAKEDTKDNTSQPAKRPNFVQGNLNAAEIEAELHRRFAAQDAQLLQRAADRFKALAMETLDLLEKNEEVTEKKKEGEAETEKKEAETVEFFKGLPVAATSTLLTTAEEINDFAKARVVFLRAASRVEAAKTYFVLDGFVTDHVTLLQMHSQLFHHLAAFESDRKRRLAMETRRWDLLSPLILSLNRSSFETLHKQVSYECGETALALLDLKLQKLHGSGSEPQQRPSKAESAKINELCQRCLGMFAHFTYLYATSLERQERFAYAQLQHLSLCEISTVFCSAPDETLITLEEVRPFLNAVFLSCRALSKVVVLPSNLPSTQPRDRAFYLVQALRRYEWLVGFTKRICDRRGISAQEVFEEELQICRDMVQLLPGKIDRMCYLGEGGLSL